MKIVPILALSLALTACATPTARPVGATATAAPAYSGVGLERVVGQNVAGLVQLFGDPDADIREGAARKLQFGSAICVLDAYLYPRGTDKEGAEPRVTYLDAREPDGSAIDRASCVAALTRRREAR